MVEHLARRTLEVLAFVRADRHDEREHLKMELSPQAQWRYAQLYRGELHDGVDDGAIGALLERSAPMLLRLAMLMALTDLQTRIDAQQYRPKHRMGLAHVECRCTPRALGMAQMKTPN